MLVVLPLLVAILILVVIGVLAFALVAGGEEATLQDGLHFFTGVWWKGIVSLFY